MMVNLYLNLYIRRVWSTFCFRMCFIFFFFLSTLSNNCLSAIHWRVKRHKTCLTEWTKKSERAKLCSFFRQTCIGRIHFFSFFLVLFYIKSQRGGPFDKTTLTHILDDIIYCHHDTYYVSVSTLYIHSI